MPVYNFLRCVTSLELEKQVQLPVSVRHSYTVSRKPGRVLVYRFNLEAKGFHYTSHEPVSLGGIKETRLYKIDNIDLIYFYSFPSHDLKSNLMSIMSRYFYAWLRRWLDCMLVSFIAVCFRLVYLVAKSAYYFRHVHPADRTLTARLLRDGLTWNFIYAGFYKTLSINFNCWFTVHFDKYKTILPTNAPFIKT